MNSLRSRKHFFYSLLLHSILIIVLVSSFEWRSRTPVLENSKNTEIINAVIMSQLPSPPTKTLTPVVKSVPPKPIPPEKIVKKSLPIPKPIKQAIIIPDKKHKKLVKQKQFNQKELEKSLEKEMKEATAKSLQKQLQSEQKRMAVARTQKMQGEVDKYKALVLQAISQRWIVPPTVNKKLYCELLIRVAPGGMVLDVQLSKSSGDPQLDNSARAAVFRASPLPVPTDSDAFNQFRQFVLKVKPENLLSKDSWEG